MYIARIKVRFRGDCVFLQMDVALVLGDNREEIHGTKSHTGKYILHLTEDMNGMVNFWRSHELFVLLPLTVHDDFTASWHPSF